MLHSVGAAGDLIRGLDGAPAFTTFFTTAAFLIHHRSADHGTRTTNNLTNEHTARRSMKSIPPGDVLRGEPKLSEGRPPRPPALLKTGVCA